MTSARDPHDEPTLDLNDPANQGLDLRDDDPLPDIPDAGPNSQPITSPDPIDFSTAGITFAGSVGASTFNDGDDQTLFERTADAFEASGVQSPQLGGGDAGADAAPKSARRVRIYG